MSWQDDVDAVYAEKRREKEAQLAERDAKSATEIERLARLDPLLKALYQVHNALNQRHWPAAYRSRQGLFRLQCSAEMSVPEITEEGYNEGSRYRLTASIIYYRYPSSGDELIMVRAGANIGADECIDKVRFIGKLWGGLTPALVKRAAARYCVEHKVDLGLG